MWISLKGALAIVSPNGLFVTVLSQIIFELHFATRFVHTVSLILLLSLYLFLTFPFVNYA